jgi:hypothetical protein
MDQDPNLDPDPPILAIDLQEANKKTNFSEKVFCLLLFKVHLHLFSKIINQKEVTKQ